MSFWSKALSTFGPAQACSQNICEFFSVNQHIHQHIHQSVILESTFTVKIKWRYGFVEEGTYVLSEGMDPVERSFSESVVQSSALNSHSFFFPTISSSKVHILGF